MKRLKELFLRKRERVLNVYCTAGFPQKDSTLAVMTTLQQAGADIIELGIPYSDPLADGTTIQASSSQALANGMTVKLLFEQLQGFRQSIHVPVVLMGYLNPVLQFGFEAFCQSAAAAGIDGLIIPDLPMHEYETVYGEILKKYGLDFIFLVTPETTEDRIRRADRLSSGFLYAVSSSSLTGSAKDFTAVEAYLQRLQQMQLHNPVLVGFGIKDRQTFDLASRYTNGAIVGSAYIEAIRQATDMEETTRQFLAGITG
jgi:tryptophan synthase alpha chain